MKKLLVCSTALLLILSGCAGGEKLGSTAAPTVAGQSESSPAAAQLQGGKFELEAGLMHADGETGLVQIAAPVYPQEALTKGVTGRVTVRALIECDGTVSQVVFETGDPIFKDAVCAVVKSARFTTGPSRLWVTIPMTFSL